MIKNSKKNSLAQGKSHHSRNSANSNYYQLELLQIPLYIIGDSYLPDIWQRFESIISCYRQLLALDTMDDSQAKLMDKILSLGESNRILADLLSQVDDTISLKSGLALEFAQLLKDSEDQTREKRLKH